VNIEEGSKNGLVLIIK